MYLMKKVSILLMISCLSFAGQLKSQAEHPKIKKLVALGRGSVFKAADEFRLSIGVITRDKNAQSALSKNSEKMNRVIGELKKLGLEEKEYQTARFSIRPIYSQRPQSPAPDWSAQIVGYETENKISIKTEKISLAGKIIDTTTSQDANSVENIYFSLKNQKEGRKEAIEQATVKAIEEAKILAQAADVKLGKIFALFIDPVSNDYPRAGTAFFAKSSAFESTPIEGGEVEVSASVKIVYELE